MCEKSPKLVIVDGSSLLTTAFWGTAPNGMQRGKTEEDYRNFYGSLMKTSTGIYTNAVYPMLSQLMNLIREQKPTHMAIVFDKSRETLIRREWYKEYKANRRITPLALKSQFEIAERVLIDMGFKVFFNERYEADDFAGSIAKKFANEIPVYLMTKDADYLQLIDDNIKVWMLQKDVESAQALVDKYCEHEWNLPRKTFEYNSFIVFSEYGVFPEQIIDMKAIQGDASDNIPGVNGVSSAAIPLLQKYKTVEGIYNVLDGKSETELDSLKELWKNELGLKRSPIKNLIADKDAKTGMSAKETAMLSKKLATIITNLPLNITLDDLRLVMSREGYNESLKKLEKTKL